MPAFNHLILIPCHGIYGSAHGDPEDDRSWYLKEFQKGEGRLLAAHIKAGVEIASRHPHSLLVFSGGQTSSIAGPLSEAQSYWFLAERVHWWGYTRARERSLTEDFARDSFENLLFSICRFRQFVGRYPEKISVAGWAFKQERFARYCRYLRFPPPQFFYEGINDPPDLENALRGEERALASGQEGSEEKRRERNPFRHSHGYSETCPELGPLLANYNKTSDLPRLPWNC